MATKPTAIAEAESPATVSWDHARRLVAHIKHGFRVAIAAQILAGQEILANKIALGFHGSGRKKKSLLIARAGKSLNRTWDDWCKSELGISSDTADRLILTFEAATDRLRRLGGHDRAVKLLSTSPEQLDEEARKTLSTLVDKLEWPDSQAALLAEFREISKQHKALEGGATPKPPQLDAEQLAFAFFSKVPEVVDKSVRALTNVMASPDYQALLHKLPVRASTPDEIGLEDLKDTLEGVMKGDLARLLADVKQALDARLQSQAAGR